MITLTPLENVPAFTNAIRDKLAEYWITSLEEFVGTARAGNATYQSGLAALAQELGLAQDQARALVVAAQAALPPGFAFDVAVDMILETGAIFEGMQAPSATAFDLPMEDLPPEKLLTAGMPPAVKQGRRKTCVAFTLAAMVQQLSGDPTDLSEQFLYWASKQRDKIAGDIGTLPDVAMNVLKEIGICSEATWAYNDVSNPANPGQGPPPTQAADEARLRRISDVVNMPPKNIQQIKATIAAGKSVLLGMTTAEGWSSWQAQRLGRVRKPLPGEARGGGHAMLAVGYRDDASAPGGGYFVVRNSWGPEWASENPDGPGYAHIPYSLVFENNQAAFAAAGMAPPPAAGADQLAAGAAPVAAADVQALYQEARRLVATTLSGLARLNEIMLQLGELIEPAASPASHVAPAIAAADALPSPALADAPASATPIATSAAVDAGAGPGGPTGPLILVGAGARDPQTLLATNGILATTGEPLLTIDRATASQIAQSNTLAKTKDPMFKVYATKQAQGQAHYGLALGDENSLTDAGWAIVVNANDDSALLKALSPLIRKRCKDQGFPEPALEFRDGETCGQWLRRSVAKLSAPMASKIPVLVYLPGESATEWLARHGTSQGPVNPEMGVPFYLMLVGRPGPLSAGDSAYIPFAVQYELDIFWGVGRLCFTDPQTGQHTLKAYADYAEQVVAFEQLAQAPYRKHIVYFGTRHDLDPSTQLSAEQLITPLFKGRPDQKSIAERLGFTQQLFLGDGDNHATRDNLGRILRGETEQGQPALLFTASHGVGFPAGDARLIAQQGALVCQDWTGYGGIKREHWYAAEDLIASQPKVSGLIAFCFACYGAGCPQEDQFVFKPNQGRPAIAPYPLIAQLPQQLLAHGALAVLGHVDRAWSHSFSPKGAPAQTQSFMSVLGRLMGGDRLGRATDQFNVVQGAIAAQLANLIEEVQEFEYEAPDGELSEMWIARNDARNYALLGDPAVQLKLPE